MPATLLKDWADANQRLEAFSDGILAIIITIMVLELKVPHEPTLETLGGSVTGF